MAQFLPSACDNWVKFPKNMWHDPCKFVSSVPFVHTCIFVGKTFFTAIFSLIYVMCSPHKDQSCHAYIYNTLYATLINQTTARQQHRTARHCNDRAIGSAVCSSTLCRGRTLQEEEPRYCWSLLSWADNISYDGYDAEYNVKQRHHHP